MTGHADTLVLSAYLDRELAAEEQRQVEDHLASCPGCRADLASLRRVVAGLRFSERIAPPPLLAENIARRVAIEAKPLGLLDRVERLLDLRLPLASSTLVVFASVLALAAIGAFFSRGVEVSRQLALENARSELVSVVWHGRTFDREVLTDRQGSAWRERDAVAATERLAANQPTAVKLLQDLGIGPDLQSMPSWLDGAESLVLFDSSGRAVEIELVPEVLAVPLDESVTESVID